MLGHTSLFYFSTTRILYYLHIATWCMFFSFTHPIDFSSLLGDLLVCNRNIFLLLLLGQGSSNIIKDVWVCATTSIALLLYVCHYISYLKPPIFFKKNFQKKNFLGNRTSRSQQYTQATQIGIEVAFIWDSKPKENVGWDWWDAIIEDTQRDDNSMNAQGMFLKHI